MKHTQSIPRPPPPKLARHSRRSARAPPRGQNFLGPVMLRALEAFPVQVRTQLLAAQTPHRLRSLSQPLPLRMPLVPRQQLHPKLREPRTSLSREATGSRSIPRCLSPKHLRQPLQHSAQRRWQHRRTQAGVTAAAKAPRLLARGGVRGCLTGAFRPPGEQVAPLSQTQHFPLSTNPEDPKPFYVFGSILQQH